MSAKHSAGDLIWFKAMRTMGMNARKAAAQSNGAFQHLGQSFAESLQSNILHGFNATKLGKALFENVTDGLQKGFYDISRKRSAEMWKRTSSALLFGGTGARSTAAGNALMQYGGNAETYNQTMMGLQSRLTGLKFGQADWVKEAMMKSGGLLDIYGSGENGFATQEELIENLAKIKDEIPVGQFHDVANALGITADIQKAILDDNLDFIKKRNYLTASEEKDMKEYGRLQLRTAAAMEKASQLWGAKTVLWWKWWEDVKGSFVEGWAGFLTKGTTEDEPDLKGKNDSEKIDEILKDPYRAKKFKDEYQGKDQELLEGVHRADYSPSSIRAYANATGLSYAQADANAEAFRKNQKFDGNVFIDKTSLDLGRWHDYADKEHLEQLRKEGIQEGLEADINKNDSQLKEIAKAKERVKSGKRLEGTEFMTSLPTDFSTKKELSISAAGGAISQSERDVARSAEELFGGESQEVVLKNLEEAERFYSARRDELSKKAKIKDEILHGSPADRQAVQNTIEWMNQSKPHDAKVYDLDPQVVSATRLPPQGPSKVLGEQNQGDIYGGSKIDVRIEQHIGSVESKDVVERVKEAGRQGGIEAANQINQKTSDQKLMK